jgi:pyruvate dehydrogenase E1 component alpha subunit
MNRDPIDRFETVLIEEGTLTKAEVETIWNETSALIEEAAQFGLDSPLPELEDALKDLYVNT